MGTGSLTAKTPVCLLVVYRVKQVTMVMMAMMVFLHLLFIIIRELMAQKLVFG